jgi:hypothetical protein
VNSAAAIAAVPGFEQAAKFMTLNLPILKRCLAFRLIE